MRLAMTKTTGQCDFCAHVTLYSLSIAGIGIIHRTVASNAERAASHHAGQVLPQSMLGPLGMLPRGMAGVMVLQRK